MTTLVVTSKGTKSEMPIPDQPMTVLVAQQGIRVDIPEADLYLDGFKTIQYLNTLTEKDWQYVSVTSLFKTLFELVFPPTQEKNFSEVEIPKTLDELLAADLGVQHVCGMIIMLGEAMFKAQDEGKKTFKVFIREVESHLHPAAQQHVMDMIKMFTGETPTVYE